MINSSINSSVNSKQIQNMVNNNIFKTSNFKEKTDNFGIGPSENSFKKTLRSNNNQSKKNEEKYNIITNLPLKQNDMSISTIISPYSNPNKKELFSNYEPVNNNKTRVDDETLSIGHLSQKGSSVKEYAYSENQNSKFRNYMEDCCKIVDKFMGEKTKGVFALFDGHGGSDVVKHVRERFPDLFSYYLYNSKSNVEQSFINSFKKLDEEIMKGRFGENMGSTACVAYFTHENNLISGLQRVVFTANVGDTRAVVVSKNSCKRLTVDHKCSDKEEEKRIRNAGGVLIDGRVFGQLILARAFGDFAFKKYGVTCLPFINKYVITENDLFIVLASDGVWDVVNEDNMLDLFRNNSSISTGKMSDLIVKHVMNIGSQDNISCLVIKLN